MTITRSNDNQTPLNCQLYSKWRLHRLLTVTGENAEDLNITRGTTNRKRPQLHRF